MADFFFSVNHQILISCNLRIAGDTLGCFYSFCCCLLTEVEFQSLSLTLDGEFTNLIRNVTSSEINCNEGNIRLIDNTVSISLEKATERCVPYLTEILCSSADLTASLFQWSKSIHIFQPRVMSGSFSWFQQLSNPSFGWQWSNMNIFFANICLAGAHLYSTIQKCLRIN